MNFDSNLIVRKIQNRWDLNVKYYKPLEKKIIGENV